MSKVILISVLMYLVNGMNHTNTPIATPDFSRSSQTQTRVLRGAKSTIEKASIPSGIICYITFAIRLV